MKKNESPFSELDKKIIRITLAKMISERAENIVGGRTLIKIFPNIMSFSREFANEIEKAIAVNRIAPKLRSCNSKSKNNTKEIFNVLIKK